MTRNFWLLLAILNNVFTSVLNLPALLEDQRRHFQQCWKCRPSLSIAIAMGRHFQHCWNRRCWRVIPAMLKTWSIFMNQSTIDVNTSSNAGSVDQVFLFAIEREKLGWLCSIYRMIDQYIFIFTYKSIDIGPPFCKYRIVDQVH
jgi:hypothetical protein